MKYALIEDNVVVQVQPNDENGFILVPDSVVCGMTGNVEDGFISPEKSQDQVNKNRIIEIKNELQQLDFSRIRPVAEGDDEYLNELNENAIALRAELQELI